MKSNLYEKILDGFEIAKIGRLTQSLGYFRVLIGEVQRLDKDPTEDQVKGVLKKLIKGCNETYNKMSDISGASVLDLKSELSFYESFLPTKMAEHDLRLLIQALKAGGTSLGDTMKQLSSDYEGQYDGAAAARLYKEIR